MLIQRLCDAAASSKNANQMKIKIKVNLLLDDYTSVRQRCWRRCAVSPVGWYILHVFGEDAWIYLPPTTKCGMKSGGKMKNTFHSVDIINNGWKLNCWIKFVRQSLMVSLVVYFGLCVCVLFHYSCKLWRMSASMPSASSHTNFHPRHNFISVRRTRSPSKT